MWNATYTTEIPLHEPTTSPVPPLLPFISDTYLLLILPIVAYWTYGYMFYWFDQNGYFTSYRLHISAEFLKRNRVSLSEVIRSVVSQQVVSFLVGVLLMPEGDRRGREEYDILVWAARLRATQRVIPWFLAMLGVDAKPWATSLTRSNPTVAGMIRGGQYANTGQPVSAVQAGYTGWETVVAKVIYWYLVPTVQFAVAIFIADSWQYFCHRAVHLNKWLYGAITEFPTRSESPPLPPESC